MKIAIDASRAINEKAGVGKYVLNLVKHLIKHQEYEFLLIFNYAKSDAEKEKLIKTFAQKNVKIKVLRFPGKIKDWLLKSPFGFSRFLVENADVFISPTFLDFDLTLKIPQVLVVHDLTNFLFPEHAGAKISQIYQKMTRVSCQKAARIITVSESTRSDVTKLLNIDPDKVVCIYPGTIGFPEIASILPNDLKSKSYIFNVGTIEPRKNLVNLIKAYNLLSKNIQEKYPLAIAGAKGWNNQTELNEFGKNKNIVWLGYVTDSELGKLYQEAKVFVYPSLYEGFGLPIAEAMQFSVPVITSNVSSMPEVVGEAGILIDPEKPEEIKSVMEELLSNEVKLESMKQKSLSQAEKFSWDKTAVQTLDLLDSTLNKHT